jgi:DNA-binding IclR family transcriptional regulator
MEREPSGGLASVDRALETLELLRDRGSVRVMDVADHLGVARSTAHRLLTALLRRQFAVQGADKVYRPGPALAVVGVDRRRAPRLARTVHPHLETLAAKTGETCHLAVLEGNGARFIDSVESKQVLRVGSRVGMLLPAHMTAVGKALLAELSETEFVALYPRGIPGTGRPIPRRTALREELATTRRRGFATNVDESERGVTAVAVALKDEFGRPLASMAVASPTVRCPRSRIRTIVEALRAAGAEADSV